VLSGSATMAHSDEVSPLEIRPARPEEFPAIAELCVTAYEPFVPPGHHYLGVLRDVAPRASGAELLVARFRRAPGRDWSPAPGVDLLTFVFNAR
jgi:hypothetical protein